MIKLLQLFLPYLFTFFLSLQTTIRQKLILDPNLKKYIKTLHQTVLTTMQERKKKLQLLVYGSKEEKKIPPASLNCSFTSSKSI